MNCDVGEAMEGLENELPSGRSEITMWENILILKNKERVMNFEISPWDFLTKANRGCKNDDNASYRRQQQPRYG